nr:TMV resistance protein N-like [Malus domestica]
MWDPTRPLTWDPINGCSNNTDIIPSHACRCGIKNLTGAQELALYGCNNLESVPNSIYNLNSLETLRFDGCLKLKQLPPFSVGFHSLQELNISNSGILEIPDRLVCLISLQDLDLCGTMIESIPASVKQATHLYRLCLNNCKSLQSLPELPCMLFNLEAHGYTSMQTVLSVESHIGRSKR